ncbi:MAG: DUF4340 domain-containing protein [Desulfobacterales bacterium]|jgi:hypothetical protein
MKSKTVLVLILLVVVLAALAAVMLRPGQEGAQKTVLGQKLFADIPFQDVTKIRIITRNETTTIVKTPRGWGVEEKAGYPADFAKISELVEKCRDLKVGRSFAADDQVLDRLALYPPAQAGVGDTSTATKLVFTDKDDRPLLDLRIGKARESDQGFGGHYLMREGQPTVYLVDKTFKFLSAAPDNWLHRQVINLDSETVESVAFYRSGDQRPAYELRRPAKGQDFVISGVKGKTSLVRSKAGRVAAALSPLQAEDVLPAAQAGKDVSFDKADRFVYTTFDGRSYGLELGGTFSRDKETFTYARLSKTTSPGKGEPEADEYSGWIYVLSEWKMGDFIREPGELLASPK